MSCLFERKVVRHLQFRKGPNKVGFLRLLHPFRDGLKLLRKERRLKLLRKEELKLLRKKGRKII